MGSAQSQDGEGSNDTFMCLSESLSCSTCSPCRPEIIRQVDTNSSSAKMDAVNAKNCKSKGQQTARGRKSTISPSHRKPPTELNDSDDLDGQGTAHRNKTTCGPTSVGLHDPDEHASRGELSKKYQEILKSAYNVPVKLEVRPGRHTSPCRNTPSTSTGRYGSPSRSHHDDKISTDANGHRPFYDGHKASNNGPAIAERDLKCIRKWSGH